MRLEQSAAWGDFVAMQEALHARLSGQLQSGSNLSEADYAVLAVLQRRRKFIRDRMNWRWSSGGKSRDCIVSWCAWSPENWFPGGRRRSWELELLKSL